MHCRGCAPWRIHAHGARRKNQRAWPVHDFLRTIMRTCSKFYFGMTYLEGEGHPKMKISYILLFGAPSRMVKVQGAWESRLNI